MNASPQLFWDTISAHHRSSALKAALDLQLFGAFEGDSSSAEELASRLSLSGKGVRVLCDFLTIMGFLTKADDRYALTEDSALFLVPQSPAYVGRAAEFLFSAPLLESMTGLREAVRRGGTALQEETVSHENPVWVEFARGMAALMHMPAQMMAEMVTPSAGASWNVLDVAAGHGMFGIAQALRHPQARVTALDWPGVLEVARENATRAGVVDRYTWLPGDAFEVDFGGPYDLILLTNFLHHFDRETCVRLLRKVRAALRADGTVVTLEFVPNEDRVTPPDRAGFSLIMLATTEKGDAYPFSELSGMLAEAGFGSNELRRLPMPGDVIISRVG